MYSKFHLIFTPHLNAMYISTNFFIISPPMNDEREDMDIVFPSF
jgi:hypothetical protein